MEIDRSLFSKRKTNSDQILPEQWIFGDICLENVILC